MKIPALSVLIAGAALLATPVLAQNSSQNSAAGSPNSAGSNVSAAPDNATAGGMSANGSDTMPNNATASGMSANGSAAMPNTAANSANGSANMQGNSTNTQTAMNGNASASDNSGLSGIADTEKKYRRASRNADFSKEQQITKELNEAENQTNNSGNTSIQ